MTYTPTFRCEDLEVTAAQYEAHVSYREWVNGNSPREYAEAATRAFEGIMDSHAYVFGDAVNEYEMRWEWHGPNVWSYTHNDMICYVRWNGRGTWTYAIFNETRGYEVMGTGTRSGAGLLDTWAYTVLSVLAEMTAEHDYHYYMSF